MTPQTALLPTLLLKNYLHFLSRRPISGSNLHFKAGRIASLQTLAPLLDQECDEEMRQGTRMLRALTTTNLARFAPQILRGLQRHKEPPLPRSLIASLAAPPPEFFAGVRRALLILGQGIGIGDEILTFPLATSLRRAMPSEASLTVLSSYRDLWRDVDGVDEQHLYGGLRELVDAIRNGGYDLVVMVDFERPGLLTSMASEPTVTRYIELAMGLRELSALDKTAGRLWKLEHPDPYYANFYHHMQRMQVWLGDTPAPRPVAAPRGRCDRELVIYASPFTSKEDPSERFWTGLLLGMLPTELPPGLTVRILIDSGANFSTRAFAVELARAVQGDDRLGLICETASTIGLGGSLLSLADAMHRIQRADIVVTSDSFPAHAGQLYGKLTLVLARDGVENWRAPAPGNFYLRAALPMPQLAAQARVLLGDLAGLTAALNTPPSLVLLHQAATALQASIGGDDSTLRAAWQAAREATLSALAESADGSAGYDVLFSDNDYTQLLPPLPQADLRLPSLQTHIRCRHAEWLNSNLLKFACWPADASAHSLAEVGRG